MNACKHPLYAERYQHTKRRLGRQSGPKVAQIELSRKLTTVRSGMLRVLNHGLRPHENPPALVSDRIDPRYRGAGRAACVTNGRAEAGRL